MICNVPLPQGHAHPHPVKAIRGCILHAQEGACVQLALFLMIGQTRLEDVFCCADCNRTAGYTGRPCRAGGT